MNSVPHFSRVFLGPLIGLTLGLTACSPQKEHPPKPQVSASSAADEKAGGSKVTKPMAALPSIGPAPAWKLTDVNGKLVNSEEFKGKVVVVDFWATWCPPCREEIPGYIQLVKKYGKDGLVIVGVSVDEGGPAVVKSYMTKAGVNYRMVMANSEVAAAFGGVEVLPTTFLIDRNGQIRDRKEGSEATAEYEKKILAVLN